VVLNTAAFLPPAGKRFPWRLRLLHGRNRFTALAVQGLNLFSWGASWMATARALDPAVKAGLMAPYDSWRHRLALVRFVQDIPTRPGHRSRELCQWTDDHLSALVDRPMLICWGERDFVFDRHFLDEWRRRFPLAQVHAFPDAGHYVMEDARERVIELVRGFLAANRNAGR